MSTKGAASKFVVKPTSRVIVLHGQDSFQITQFTRQAIEVFEAAHGEVERFDFDGEEAELAEVLDELRSYGLAQRYKIVVLDQADKFIGGEERKRYRTAIENYARQPVDSATLIMRADTWRKSNLDKLIEKVGVIHKVEPPGEARAVGWCRQRATKRYEAEIDTDAAELLVRLIGVDLERLDMEISKLAAYVGNERSIARQDVMELVGMSREDKIWTIQAPIARGDAAAALRMHREMMEISRQPQELLIWAICDLLRKLHAAAQLFSEGANAGAVAKQLGLQHWMESTKLIQAVAPKQDPAELAALFDLAIRTDQRNKSGLAEPDRSLEALTMRIADSMKR